MNVLRLKDTGFTDIQNLFNAFGLQIEQVADGAEIPGSHWGDEEAGLIRNKLFVRSDTPVHSALHEGCHWLLMDNTRRAALHTNAGGTMMEENAVCYLQILLSDRLNGVGRAKLMQDMDTWGYSFRLGSTQAWFETDAEDALAFLQSHPIVSELRLNDE